MLGVCLAVVQVRYHFTEVSLPLHATVVGLLLVWAGISWACQAALHRPAWAAPAQAVDGG